MRNLNPCTDPTSQHWDLPAVLPANIQNPDGYIVQIGYIECGAPGSATCSGVPSDGNLHFVYICDDLSGGLPCLADSWAGSPVVGRRYKFRVQYNQLGTQKWDYSIEGLTTGTTYSKSVTSHWHNGDLAWYGAESHDFGSTLGPKHFTDNGLNMNRMQYFRTSVGNWRMITDLVYADFPAVAHLLNGTSISQPSWYTRDIQSKNYTNDEIEIFTEDH